MRMKLLIVYWKSLVEMRLLWPSRTKKPRNMTHSKKEEPPREDAKMDFLQTQGNKLEAHGEEKCNSESIAELLAGGEILRAGSTTESVLFHCFTAGGYLDSAWLSCCFWLGRFVLWFFLFVDLLSGSPPFVALGCTRPSSFHDCHHCHNERSTGAKKKGTLTEGFQVF